MVSEKGPGFGWSVLQPDWSMPFECNYSIYVGIIIILVEREWSDKFIISS
jgi:hypothetical protein